MEEDVWLNCQLIKYKDTMKSINMGEDLIKEFIMYSLGVPLSKRFMAASMQCFNERFRLVMKMHPEFTDLPCRLQEKLWQNNIMYCVALNIVKLESASTAEEQLDFAGGYSDLDCVKHFMDRSSIKKLKKLTQADNNKTSGLLSAGLLQNFVRLTSRIGDFIKDKSIYQLFSIVLMFSDVDTKDLKSLYELKTKYMNIIRRKVDAQLREAYKAKKRKTTGATKKFTCSSQIVSLEYSFEYFIF